MKKRLTRDFPQLVFHNPTKRNVCKLVFVPFSLQDCVALTCIIVPIVRIQKTQRKKGLMKPLREGEREGEGERERESGREIERERRRVLIRLENQPGAGGGVRSLHTVVQSQGEGLAHRGNIALGIGKSVGVSCVCAMSM